MDLDADDEDLKLIREAFTIPRSDILRKLVREPSEAFPYSEELGGTFSIAEAQKAYERRSADSIVRMIMEAQEAEGLAEAIDLEISRNYYDDLLEVTSEDYDEYADDIVIGNRDHGIRLVGDSHMVRVLATKKAGKTTFVLELIRCSLTGERAFNAFDIKPLEDDERILFIDPELQESSFRRYMKPAFAGMTKHQVDDQFIRISTRSNVTQFDLMSEQTRDELVRVINMYNIKRVVFDSYVKLIPNGSVSKEDDVKRMLANWNYVQANTDVRESFWVGHVNNGGEIRSSGSILLDGTFESLLTLIKDTEGRRFFQSEEGRMTDAVAPKPYVLDPANGRPLIMLDSLVTPAPGAGVKKKEDLEEEARRRDESIAVIRKLLLRSLYDMGEMPFADGTLAYGGMNKTQTQDAVLGAWATEAKYLDTPTRPFIDTVRNIMVSDDNLLIYAYPAKGGVKLYALSPVGQELVESMGED